MRFKNSIVCFAAACFFIFLGASWQQEEHKPQNLKVLPKNISHEELHKIMDDYKVALGVKCGFCHAESKDNPGRLDFASDDNKQKDIARNMMKMTAKINSKYFSWNKDKEGNAVMTVGCMTCHNGNKEPKS